MILAPTATLTKQGEKQMRDNPHGALGIFWLRQRVRQTASLVSPFGRVTERVGSSWAADYDKRVIVWSPLNPLTGDIGYSDDELLFLITHEAGHLNFSGGYEFPEWIKSKSLRLSFHGLMNATEDIRIERLLLKDFPGFAEPRQKVTRRMLTGQNLASQDMLRQVGCGLIALHSGWTPQEVRSILVTAEAWEIISQSLTDFDTAASQASTGAMVPHVERIFKRLITEAPQGDGEGDEGEGDEDGEPGGSGSGKGKGEKSESQSENSESESGSGSDDSDEDGDDTDAEGDGETTDGDGDVENTSSDEGGEDAKGGEEAGFNSADKNADADPERTPKPQEFDNRPSSVTSDFDNDPNKPENKDNRSHGPAATAEYMRDNMNPTGSSDSDARRWDNAHYIKTWDSFKAKHRGEINTLSHRIKSVLRNNAQDAYEGGKRRGRLDSRRAYRAAAGNTRIFKQKHAVGKTNYTVGIIIDVSGSMATVERRSGMTRGDILVTITEAVESAGLHNFVVVWDDQPVAIKPVDASLASRKGVLAGRWMSGGGTYEAPALMLAQEEFRKARRQFPETEQILFTITDGHTSWPQESEEILGMLTRDGVTCIGIGLANVIPKHYPRHIGVSDIRGLSVELPKMLRSLVKRGG